jgi:V/A-type H+-transporting ATPase subunit E
MAEELQSLLERIQKDGVEKAEHTAAEIEKEARARAEAIVAEAESAAEATRESAAKEAAALEARSRTALQQAARDVVLSVAESVQALLARVVAEEVSASLDDETLKQMLTAVAQAYCADEGSGGIDVWLPESQQKQVRDYFMSTLVQRLKAGVDIKGDSEVVAGFRVSVKQDRVAHDFTADAIASALCELLRPELAKIVKEAADGNAS